MKTVVVCIGGDNYFSETQTFDLVFDAQGHHQIKQFFILINSGFIFSEYVLGLASQRENGLGIHIAGRYHRTGGGLALGNKYHGLITMLIAKMVLAILQIGNLEGYLFGRIPGLFLHGVQLFTQFFVTLDFLLQAFGGLFVFVQKVDYRRFYLAHNPAANFTVAQLVFGLTLKHRVLQLYRNGPGHPFPYIHAAVVLLKKLVGSLQQTLAEGAQMSSPVAGILAVYNREIGLAVGIGMGKGKLKMISLQMSDFVEGLVSDFSVQQVKQTIFRQELLFIKPEGQSCV